VFGISKIGGKVEQGVHLCDTSRLPLSWIDGTRAANHVHGHSLANRPRHYPRDNLAFERSVVETALAGYYEIRALEPLLEVHHSHHEVEATRGGCVKQLLKGKSNPAGGTRSA